MTTFRYLAVSSEETIAEAIEFGVWREYVGEAPTKSTDSRL